LKPKAGATTRKRRQTASKKEIACSPQEFAAFKRQTRDAAAKIAAFVGAADDGTGRVDFQDSKRLPGVEGYAVCSGDTVWLSVEGISSNAACVMLEALRFMKNGSRR
jgi:hypothetical protein